RIVQAPLGAPDDVGRKRAVGVAAHFEESLLVQRKRAADLVEAERIVHLPFEIGRVARSETGPEGGNGHKGGDNGQPHEGRSSWKIEFGVCFLFLWGNSTEILVKDQFRRISGTPDRATAADARSSRKPTIDQRLAGIDTEPGRIRRGHGSLTAPRGNRRTPSRARWCCGATALSGRPTARPRSPVKSS